MAKQVAVERERLEWPWSPGVSLELRTTCVLLDISALFMAWLSCCWLCLSGCPICCLHAPPSHPAPDAHCLTPTHHKPRTFSRVVDGFSLRLRRRRRLIGCVEDILLGFFYFLVGFFIAFLYNGDTTPLLRFGGLFSLFLFTVFFPPFFIICFPLVVFTPTFGGVVAYRACHTAHREFVTMPVDPRGGFFIFFISTIFIWMAGVIW